MALKEKETRGKRSKSSVTKPVAKKIVVKTAKPTEEKTSDFGKSVLKLAESAVDGFPPDASETKLRWSRMRVGQ